MYLIFQAFAGLQILLQIVFYILGIMAFAKYLSKK